MMILTILSRRELNLDNNTISKPDQRASVLILYPKARSWDEKEPLGLRKRKP